LAKVEGGRGRRRNDKKYGGVASQEAHKGADLRPLIREETRRFIIYIRRTSLSGLAYTVRAVARHLNCRRVQRAVINRAGDRN